MGNVRRISLEKIHHFENTLVGNIERDNQNYKSRSYRNLKGRNPKLEIASVGWILKEKILNIEIPEAAEY